MPNEPNIAIILLAAGASSRMGDTKQLLPWNDTTLLGHAIQTAEDSDATSVIVVLGANAEAIRNNMGDFIKDKSAHKVHPENRSRSKNRIEFVENPIWKSGLGSSIACGIRHLQEKEIVYDAAMVVLADQPLIDIGYLNSMMAHFAASQTDIVATAYENKAGVPALFSRRYFKSLSNLGDDQGAQKMINDPDGEALILDPGNRTVDIDTKQEYRNLIKRLDKQERA